MREPRRFETGEIEGVEIRQLEKHVDERGWLAELWRTDQVEARRRPVMSYISKTGPGVVRGPHEHEEQTDHFCFLGPANFKVYLWDNRPESPTYNHKRTCVVGADKPRSVIVPNGVVHGYKNISHIPGLIINCPDELYMGENYSEPVDEIRHEEDPDSPFTIS